MNPRNHRHVWVVAAVVGALIFAAGGAGRAAIMTLDAIAFGDAASEQAHFLAATLSNAVTGGLGQPARVLTPTDPPSESGGSLSFLMQCDPAKQNYFTIKLWGGDKGVEMGRLYLYCEGRQIGYRHQGDVDPLNIASNAALSPGRFFYQTLPIPLAMTQGKTGIALDIRSNGRIWPYGSTYDLFQRNLTIDSRGIYKGYTHTDPAFVPAADDVQGAAPADVTRPAADETARLNSLRTVVNNRLNGYRNPASFPDLLASLILAKAYHIPWTNQYRQAATLQRIIAMIDDKVRRWANDGTVMATEPKWRSLGPAGYAAWLVRAPLESGGWLDQLVDHDGNAATPSIARRAAWSEAFRASLSYRRQNRPMFSNQAQISDLNLYLSNLGIRAVDPAKAMPEAQVRRYIREAVGIEPWRDSDDASGNPRMRMGANYYTATSKGLTKELGFVGLYGEVLDWVCKIYEATCADGGTGDPDIRAQLLRMAEARSFFRVPWTDGGGCRSMMLANFIGWRDSDYPDPSGAIYGNRTAWESSAVRSAALLRDASNVGFAKQQLADNQFWQALDDSGDLTTGNTDTSLTLLHMPDDYLTVKGLPDTGRRLPNSPGSPDYAWADEENGVVVIRRGGEMFFASLYWRAYFGINNLARVHVIRPCYSHVAVVRQKELFTASGQSYTRDNRTGDFTVNKYNVPGVDQALRGDVFPKVVQPAGVSLYSSNDYHNPYNGRANFYQLRYGHYLIGINSTSDQTYELETPEGFASARDLISGEEKSGPVAVGPGSTVVLALTVPSAPPADLTVTPDDGRVALEWSAAPGASRYVVRRATSGDGPYTVVAIIGGTTYTDADVANGVSYFYSVTGENELGESGSVNAAGSVTPMNPNGTPIPRISAVADGAGFELKMNTATGWSYRLQQSGSLAADSWQGLGSPVVGDGETLTLTDSPGGSVQGRFYRVRIAPDPVGAGAE